MIRNFENFDKEDLFGWTETPLEKCCLSPKTKAELECFTYEEVEEMTDEEIQGMLYVKASEESLRELDNLRKERQEIEKKLKNQHINSARKAELTTDMLDTMISNMFENIDDYQTELSKIGMKQEHINYLIYTEYYYADEDDLKIHIPLVINLDSRITDALTKAGIETLEDLNKLSDDEIKKIHGIGKKSLPELISWKNEINNWLANNKYMHMTENVKAGYFKPLANYLISLVETKREKLGMLRTSGFRPDEVFAII